STSHTNCLGASISTDVLMVMLRSVSSAPCGVVGGGLPAGVVAEDIDAAVSFGHVDHAATVDKDVLGLVDELRRYWAAAFLGVIVDEVPGDVRVVGIADVVDLQAGVEVGEIDVPVVGRQTVQALLLVLVVRPEPAALPAKARGVVTVRRAGLGKQRHQDRV